MDTIEQYNDKASDKKIVLPTRNNAIYLRYNTTNIKLIYLHFVTQQIRNRSFFVLHLDANYITHARETF